MNSEAAALSGCFGRAPMDEIGLGDDEETERWRGRKEKSEHSPWFTVR